MGNKKTDTYDVIYSSIRRITKLRTKEGEIRFTATMKLIYAYIWTFQENKKRGNDEPIHTNTNVLAWEMGVSEKAMIDALKALDAARVVIKRTVKVRGNVNSSNYVAIPPASVVSLGITPPHPNESKSKAKKTKKAAQPKIEESENGVQQDDEQQPSGVASESAPNDYEQRSGISESAGDSCDDVSANDAVNQDEIAIFDENNVVTEAFINSLTGDAAPNRNADGSLQSIKYVYWVARYSQDERDGIPVRTREEYMAEAKPEYFPFHLLLDDVPAPITEPAPAMQQVNGPDVDHINCEDSEETQEEVFEPPF
ncbi:hypothetical protein [Leclercia sp. UBA5958]|uniref:hypothetical protein n=1 Tax=Leclercia sp. UBA5958 TaxID=1946742 RepID=UPI00257BB3F6|nr:hypothetical protein [Leclercia sp. UBA5958]